MRLAKLAKPCGVRFQHLYDPDFWYVIETEMEVIPFFAGLQYMCDYNTVKTQFDLSNWGLQKVEEDGTLTDYPDKNNMCNYADALIYAINFFGNAFQKYKAVGYNYDPTNFVCCDYDSLLRNVPGQ